MHVASLKKPAMFAHKLKLILLPQLIATLNNYIYCGLSHVGSMYVVIYIMLFISNKGLILCILLNFIPNNLASYCINY